MIDMKPAVGRIVMRKSDEVSRVVDPTYYGPITEINGKRIALTRDGKPTYVLDWKVACVVDTQAEVESVLQFSEAAHARYGEFMQSQANAWEDFKAAR